MHFRQWPTALSYKAAECNGVEISSNLKLVCLRTYLSSVSVFNNTNSSKVMRSMTYLPHRASTASTE